MSVAEIAVQEPTQFVQYRSDPTGGRIVSWAQAADAAYQLAVRLCTTDFVPKRKVNGQDVALSVGDATAMILMGDELGFSPLAALRSIYVVKGTPALYARSMVALALSQGHEIWTVSSSDTQVEVHGKRKGSDKIEKSVWTIERATRAGYTTNPSKKYQTNPQEMLYAKAAGEVAKKVAADVIAGMPFSVEDLELEEAQTVTIQREPRKISRAPKPEPIEPGFDETPTVEATIVVDEQPTAPEPEFDDEKPVAAEEVSEPGGYENVATPAQVRAIQAMFTENGVKERPQKLNILSTFTGRPIASSKDLTKIEASRFLDESKLVAEAGSSVRKFWTDEIQE